MARVNNFHNIFKLINGMVVNKWYYNMEINKCNRYMRYKYTRIMR